MRKIFVLVLVIIAMTISGCGNYSVGFGEYHFEKIHIDTYHFSGCYTVEKWYENSSGIEVKTRELGNIFVSEGAYILVGDKCPVCEAEEATND